MEKLHFSIAIKAPKQKVWDVMLADATYREWTDVFNPEGGSYYEGNWNEGSKMLFLGPGSDGKIGGMVSRIAVNRPYEYISIEHMGEFINGHEDTTSERAKVWTEMYENYTFTEHDGVTTLKVDLDSNDMFKEMFAAMWPKALAKLKQIVEK